MDGGFRASRSLRRAETIEPKRSTRFTHHLRFRHRPSAAHVAEVVGPSPARAEPHDAAAWLPVPTPDALPELDELPVEAAPGEIPSPRDALSQPSPARAEPHDETTWLPLPEFDELPAIRELLQPSPHAEPVVARDIAVAPSPARAEPHDATTWLPLPECDLLPEITELIAPSEQTRSTDGAPAGPQTDRIRTDRDRRHRVPRLRLRRHRLRWSLLAALVVITIVGSAFSIGRVFDAGDDVELRVDDRVISAETGVSTVGSLLSEHRVTLGRDDRVTPNAKTGITNGMSIQVHRAFPVPVDLDGEQKTVYTTFRDPKKFLAGLDVGSNVVIRDEPKKITGDVPIVMRTKKVGTLLLDQTAVNYESPSLTIRELFAIYSVVLSPDDYVTLDSKTRIGIDGVLPDKASVVVVRVALLTEQVDEPYSLPDQEVKDPDLDVGKTRVEEGVPGVLRVTYRIVQHDLNSVERTPISKVPVQLAKPKITYIGTKADPRWDKMAQCETGGKWDAPGLTYQGGLGIYYANWSHYGGREFAPTAGQATREQQIIVAERIRAEYGFSAWGCAKTLGL